MLQEQNIWCDTVFNLMLLQCVDLEFIGLEICVSDPYPDESLLVIKGICPAVKRGAIHHSVVSTSVFDSEHSLFLVLILIFVNIFLWMFWFPHNF